MLKLICVSLSISVAYTPSLRTRLSVMIGLVATPIMTVAYIFALGTRNSREFEIVYLAVTSCIYAASVVTLETLAVLLAVDQNEGTTTHVALSQNPYAVVRLDHFVLSMTLGATVGGLGLVAVLPIAGRDLPLPAFLVVLLIATVIGSAGFAFFLGATGLLMRSPFALVNLGSTSMLLLGGVVLPIASYPTWIAYLSNGIPLAHVTLALHHVGEGNDGAVWRESALAVATGLLWFAVAAVLRGLAFSASRREGTLERI